MLPDKRDSRTSVYLYASLFNRTVGEWRLGETDWEVKTPEGWEESIAFEGFTLQEMVKHFYNMDTVTYFRLEINK